MELILHILTTQIHSICFSIAAVLIFIWLLDFTKELKLKWYIAAIIAALHIVLGVACARLWALIEVGFDAQRAANIRLYGPTFIFPLLYYYIAKLFKRNATLMLDIASVTVPIGLFFGRINCLITNCCYGMLNIGEQALRLPLVELEMAYYAILILCVYRRILNGKTHGQMYGVYLLSYGIIRFVFEWFREEYTTQVGFIHLAHIWSLVSIIFGAGVLCLSNRKNKNRSKAAKGRGSKPDKKN